MTIVGIHQPHYFPWLGFLDKMAHSDEFIILDKVQLENQSPMVRNKFLQLNGDGRYLSVSVNKKGYVDRETRDIELVDWSKVKGKHKRFLESNYNKTAGFSEVWPIVSEILDTDFATLFELDMATINALRELYGISTPLFIQSDLETDETWKNNDMNLGLCKLRGADVYLSGQGAKKYMDESLFDEAGVRVEYQQFEHPTYAQYRQEVFVPQLSALDMVFQCGISGARKIFWENCQRV